MQNVVTKQNELTVRSQVCLEGRNLDQIDHIINNYNPLINFHAFSLDKTCQLVQKWMAVIRNYTMNCVKLVGVEECVIRVSTHD